MWSAPLTLSIVERGQEEDHTVKIDLPSLKNNGEVFLGTHKSCEGCFVQNDYTNAMHARVRIGPAPVGSCDLDRTALGHGDYLMHIIDNRTKFGLFINGIRVLGCANIKPGDEIILGWKAARATRRGQAYGPGFHKREIKLRIDISSASVYTEEQHVAPTAILVASRKEYLAHAGRQRTVPLYKGMGELQVSANQMAASPTRWAKATTRHLGALALMPEAFDEERKKTPGARARAELAIGRPLTPDERHELVMANQVPQSEIKNAIELGVVRGKLERATEAATEVYEEAVNQAAENQRLAEEAELALQQALVEEANAADAAAWRKWRERDLEIVKMPPKDRPTTPEVTKLLEERWGDVEYDTSQMGPLFR